MFFIHKSREELVAPSHTSKRSGEKPSEESAAILGNDGKPFPQLLERFLPRLESELRLSNEIRFVRGEAEPWGSKLGGCPYLERKEDYPRNGKDVPMMFLAQINLEEMPPLPDFPTKGLLQFYIDDQEDGCYGYDEPCFVRYLPDYHRDKDRLYRVNPFRAAYREREPFGEDCRIRFTQRGMFPHPDYGPQDLLSDATEEEGEALFDACDTSGSRVGGYPMFVQSPMPYFEDGDLDVLLLQLDVDDTSGIMFGDAGNCNFFLSREALRRLDFSGAEYDWQCC